MKIILLILLINNAVMLLNGFVEYSTRHKTIICTLIIDYGRYMGGGYNNASWAGLLTSTPSSAIHDYSYVTIVIQEFI